jgi:hypothetical protein
MALIETILRSGQSGADTAKYITGKAACSRVRSRATMMGMDLGAIEASAGITRGKKLVVVVGQRKALAIAVRNNKTEQRFSGLLARLKAGG